jgi:hypothetical protein
MSNIVPVRRRLGAAVNLGLRSTIRGNERLPVQSDRRNRTVAPEQGVLMSLVKPWGKDRPIG